MKIHSPDKIKMLRKLRGRGYSINELVKKLNIPKTTVWHHIHNINISPKYLSILKSKIGGSRQRKEKNIEIAKKYAKELLKSSNREYVIVLAMLYWAEGSKKVPEFINSDSRMVNLYIKIITSVLKVPKEKIVPILRIFSGMDRTKCINYWSRATELPKSAFFVRMNDGGTRSRTKYGMCRIRIKKGSNTLKLTNSLIDQSYIELEKSI